MLHPDLDPDTRPANPFQSPRRRPSLPIIRPLPPTPFTQLSFKNDRLRFTEAAASAPLIPLPLRVRRSSGSETKTTTETRLGDKRRELEDEIGSKRPNLDSAERERERGNSENSDLQSRAKVGKSELWFLSRLTFCSRADEKSVSSNRRPRFARRSFEAVGGGILVVERIPRLKSRIVLLLAFSRFNVWIESGPDGVSSWIPCFHFDGSCIR